MVSGTAVTITAFQNYMLWFLPYTVSLYVAQYNLKTDQSNRHNKPEIESKQTIFVTINRKLNYKKKLLLNYFHPVYGKMVDSSRYLLRYFAPRLSRNFHMGALVYGDILRVSWERRKFNYITRDNKEKTEGKLTTAIISLKYHFFYEL